MQIGRTHDEGNVLIHPAILRKCAPGDGPKERFLDIANYGQIEAAFGPDAARAARAALAARVQRVLAGAGVVSPQGDSRVVVRVWDGLLGEGRPSSAGSEDWLGGLVSEIMMEPIGADLGPFHLDITDSGTPRTNLGPEVSLEPFRNGASDAGAVENLQRLYRSDMAMVSPVLAALGGFRSVADPGPDAAVCWRPIENVGAPGSPALFEATLAVVDHAGRIESSERVIAAAERLGMVRLLDHHLVSRVVDELNEARGAVAISVCVSEESLADARFWREVGERIESGGGVASDLILEIRGNLSAGVPVGLGAVLELIRRIGCRLSLGNFGVGCTSLHDMFAFRPDFITIDRYFVRRSTEAKDNLSVLSHLVGLAKAAGAEVILDSVDTAELSQLAAEVGADFCKGAWSGGPRFSRSWVGISNGSVAPLAGLGAAPSEPWVDPANPQAN